MSSQVKKKRTPDTQKKNSKSNQGVTRPPKGNAKKGILVPLILVLATFSAIVFVSLQKKQPTVGKTENFSLLVITLDTTRADHIGAYGYKKAQTPTLDRLAREGVMFENCYSPVPLTLPAHSSLFTGRFPVAHGARGNGMYRLPEKETTLAELLQANGFHTFGVISSFVLLSKFGLEQGFDVYDDSLNSHKIYNDYTSEIPASFVYRKFLQWFEKNNQKRFFAWVHFYDPHKPYDAPKKYGKEFNDSVQGRYDAEIAFTDDAVNRVIEALKAAHRLENTLVVIVGDHGEAFGEHEETGHGIFCYEEVLKVPLIFYNPRLLAKSGVPIKNRVNLTDIMPTLLEMFGLDLPASIQGKSMMPLLAGETETEPRNIYFESLHGKNEMGWAPLMGMMEGNYKFISLPEPELYDLESDSGEKENLFFKKNLLARELDKKLMKQVALMATDSSAAEAHREMSADDKSQLKSLGYISSFDDKSKTEQDPKKGIVLDNKIKRIFDVIARKELVEAQTQLDSLIAEHKEINLPIFYDLQHRLFMSQGNVDQAEVLLKEAIAKFPKLERFYILYAFKLFQRGDFPAVEEVCKKLLTLNPDFTRAHILLAEIEEKRKNVDKAIQFYRKAMDIEPRNFTLQLKTAELLITRNSFKEALALYDQLLERKELSSNPELLYKVALFNSRFGTLAKTEQMMKRCVEIEPCGKFYYNYALVLHKNKKIQAARQNMQTALDKYRAQLTAQQVDTAQKVLAEGK